MVKEYTKRFNNYILSDDRNPLFLQGDALEVLKQLPDESIDFCMTSPPYWGKRQYSGGGIGLEKDYRDFIKNLTTIFLEIKRVLKPTGSFWLNIGDTYLNKKQLGIPWRIAITLMDEQGWILRNDIVWNKVKGGMDNSKDKLGNVHEPIFHFVKQAKYYYDVDAIRSKPKEAKVVNGAIVSATGVSGVRYKRQIELSTVLTEEQKRLAFSALDSILQDVMNGKLADFRMVIKGQQRATHSDSTKVSGRAKELQEKGFYFLKYHPNGSKPTDVWDIIPEDTQQRDDNHFAPYPEDLCKIPILATCPENGIVLDPFCGTGTTMLVARQFNRKSVGIDISDSYIKVAEERCHLLV
ncbi:site-specific DNA-methyltransferase [Brevibacillus borstelensis]|jgi:site-specific DNA-methyltransferase (adenine-specific)|uniref:DNA-methyltransferase n=1 Tax=Brevibacillus borstelensis TaxID=45462 RepID=UPI001561E444|nr:site-specific DNA-methyltransferase [Brevibacillus borstelensis]MBE5394357.1 site-specific DNA-methyltransferase [Brevibacillus borstelensis]